MDERLPVDAVKLIQRLHQHRCWANEKVLAVCEPLDNAELRQPMEIGQGSIWKSLLHLYAAEYVWLEALMGNEAPLLAGDLPGKLPGNQLGHGGVVSMADLKGKWADLQSRWESYLAKLTPEKLDEIVYKQSKKSGLAQRLGTRRADVLVHVCTHAHYTMAQVVNMLRQIGTESLPDLMLISLAREEASL